MEPITQTLAEVKAELSKVQATVDTKEVTVTAEPTPEVKPEPREISRAELGKLRKNYYTRVLPTVVACGHRFDPNRQPKLACDYCYEAYFKTAVDLDEVRGLLGEGPRALAAKYGDKFVKYFKRFLHFELTIPTALIEETPELEIPTDVRDIYVKA